MLSSPDAQLALSGAQDSQLAQQKLQMDALRSRLGDQKDEAVKLREACQGFESIFLQRMWEQMRATVPEEGYLHSKEEKFWQSMFDQELSQKMASAGGVGLGDMLFDQLSATLLDASRVSSPGSVENPQIRPLHAPVNPMPMTAEAQSTQQASPLNADDLYTPLDEVVGIPVAESANGQQPEGQGDGFYDLASAVSFLETGEAHASVPPVQAQTMQAQASQAPAVEPVRVIQTPPADVVWVDGTSPAQPAAPQAAAGNAIQATAGVRIPAPADAAVAAGQALQSAPLTQAAHAAYSSGTPSVMQPHPIQPNTGLTPLNGDNHDLIMRRLAEIAYTARAPQSEIEALHRQGVAQAEQDAAAALLEQEAGQDAAAHSPAGIPAEFGASRIGSPEAVRPPQFSPVADIPVVHRSPSGSSNGPRMQHPTISRGSMTPDA